MSKQINETIDYTLKKFKKNKLVEAELIFKQSKKLSLKSEELKISEYAKSDTHSLGVRIIKDQRVGISFTEDLSPWAIDKTIENALNNAKFAKINEYSAIESTESFDYNDLKDSKDESVETLIKETIDMENEIKSLDKRAKTPPYNGLSEVESTTIMANTKGARCSYKTKFYSCYTSALLNENDKNSMHSDSRVEKNLSDIDFKSLSSKVVKTSANLLHAQQIESGEYLVKFDVKLLNSFFSAFSSLYSAKSVVDNISPWKDELGNTVIDERLSIIDSPLYENALLKSPFDMEGFKKSDVTIVKNGKLENFLHNSETAKKLKMKNNFCASRSPSSPLSVTSSNIVITASESLDSLKDIKYIEVLSAQGLHSGINSTSGNISLGVSGRVIENGEVLYYFKDSTVSGNFFEMLRNVYHTTNKIEHTTDRSFFSPEIIFKELSFAGAN